MARVNFRQIRERFTHIDARFVSCTAGFPDVVPHYAVSVYPWWEHPAYVAAIREGRPWGFADCEEGYKAVTVYPQGMLACRLSPCTDVIDWGFCEDHPWLWPYEDNGQIYCNSNPPLAALVDRVCKALPGVAKAEIYGYLDPLLPYKAPFCLGSFPFTLFQVVEQALKELNVATLISRRPERKAPPVLFLIDGSDWIIAEDFEVDVPHFEHRAEWFKSA